MRLGQNIFNFTLKYKIYSLGMTQDCFWSFDGIKNGDGLLGTEDSGSCEVAAIMS